MTALPDLPSPDDVITEALRPADVDRDEPWQVRDQQAADWAAAKMRQAHERCATETESTRKAIEALEARAAEYRMWVEAREAARDRDISFFTGALIDWLRRERRAEIESGVHPDKAVKSKRVLGGVVKSRAGTDQLDVLDAYLLAADFSIDDYGIVEFEPRIDRRNLRAYIRDTGEIPPGVAFEPATEDDRTYVVEVGE